MLEPVGKVQWGEEFQQHRQLQQQRAGGRVDTVSKTGVWEGREKNGPAEGRCAWTIEASEFEVETSGLSGWSWEPHSAKRTRK